VVRIDADRLCSTGSLRRGSPVSTLICGPPTSHHPSASAPFPVAFGLPRPHLLFLSGLRVQMKHSTPPEAGHRPSASPDFHRGGGGISRVTGPSSSCAPWSNTPPDALRPRPFAAPALSPSGGQWPWASGIRDISWLHPHGSHARAPTLRPCRCRHRRKARYRPAGLGFGRAGFAPAGRLIPISDSHRLLSFQGTGIARSHQTPTLDSWEESPL